MISTFTAFFDANVFFGPRLRSLFMELAQTGLFRARWSAAVHDEWMAAVYKKRPALQPGALDKTRQDMDSTVLDCLVTGYEPLICCLSLPDPDDRHVLAASIVCRAHMIVTFNAKDFPVASISPFGIHTCHPDDFLMDLESVSPGPFIDAIRKDWLHYKAPPVTIDNYIERLRKSSVPQTADHLTARKVLLDLGQP